MSDTLATLGNFLSLKNSLIGYTEDLNLDKIRGILCSDPKLHSLFEYLIDTVSQDNIVSTENIDYIE